MRSINLVRVAVIVLTIFIALTAIGGGIAMLMGIEDFPLVWLAGTPFPDYTIPALLLAIVVGGSSLVAASMTLARTQHSAFAACGAGVMMMGYIIVEVLTLKQVPIGPTMIEIFYFLLGLLVAVGGGLLWQHERLDGSTRLSSS